MLRASLSIRTPLAVLLGTTAEALHLDGQIKLLLETLHIHLSRDSILGRLLEIDELRLAGMLLIVLIIALPSVTLILHILRRFEKRPPPPEDERALPVEGSHGRFAKVGYLYIKHQKIDEFRAFMPDVNLALVEMGERIVVKFESTEDDYIYRVFAFIDLADYHHQERVITALLREHGSCSWVE